MNYYVRRTLRSLSVIFIVVTLTFAMIRYLPGGPMDFLRAQLLQQAGGDVSAEQMESIRRQVEVLTNVAPDEPLWKQYLDYLVAIAQGDLGQSIWFDAPVADLVAEAIPWTIFVSFTALLVTFPANTLLGALMAYFEGSRFDFSLTTFTMLSRSIPYYVFAITLVFVLGYTWGWFPHQGRFGPTVTPGLNPDFIVNVAYHAALPISSLILAGLGGSLGMRGNCIRILGSDYMRVADLRGLPLTRVSTLYLLRNAVLPAYTNVMIRIGALLGGSVILETIFGYRGVGWLMFRGISSRDYPLMMGGFLVITVAVIAGITVADFTYGKIDPRIQVGEQGEAGTGTEA